MTFNIPLISALTALVAVVVGPIVAIYVACRQIRASVVSANRQKWIDQLRDQVADLITAMRLLSFHRSADYIGKAEWVERFQKFLLVEIKINLLLNPKESDHVKLIETIRQAAEAMLEHEQADHKAVVSLTNSIVKQSQAVLKREWERVKRGD